MVFLWSKYPVDTRTDGYLGSLGGSQAARPVSATISADRVECRHQPAETSRYRAEPPKKHHEAQVSYARFVTSTVRIPDAYDSTRCGSRLRGRRTADAADASRDSRDT